ncbi:MAG: NfeD family protein [Oscillospiraceae bacterium]|nr:NfeD family protein [Oscillospiraceae bacterium]
MFNIIQFIILWVTIAIVAAVVDIATSNILYVLFSVGAICALILALFGVRFLPQFIVFGVVSIVLLVFLYPLIRRVIKERIPQTKTMEESYIGNCFMIDGDITKNNLIKYKGVYWTMIANGQESDIQKGDTVKVTGIDGNKLIIEKYYYNKTI